MRESLLYFLVGDFLCSIESYRGNSHVTNLLRHMSRRSRKAYRFALNTRKKIPAL